MTHDSIRNILRSCRNVLSVALLTLLLLTACHDGSADAPDTPKGEPATEKGNVTLDLSIGINNGGNPDTRAFSEDDDNTFENPMHDYEIVHTLRVVIVRKDVKQEDGSVKDIVEHNRMVNVSPTYADNNLNLITSYYILHDNLRFNLIGNEMKTIYLFANEDMVSDQQKFDFTKELMVGKEFPKETVENLLILRKENVAYIDNENTIVNGVMLRTHNVPMSEAFDIQVPPPSGDGEALYYQTLFLTRSLIKFSFSIAFDKGDLLPEDWEQIQRLGMKLKGVKITNLANSSYYLPKGTTYEPKKYYPQPTDYFNLAWIGNSDQTQIINTEERRITAFTVPENAGSSECIFMFKQPIEIAKQGTGETSHVSPAIYLPESKVKGNDLYYVSLIFDDESLNDQYAPAPLRGIDELKTFTTNIPRNTHIKVNMVMNLKKRDLSATVTLFPYTAVHLNPSFGFSVPVESIEIYDDSPDHTTISKECRVGESFNLIAAVLPEDANNKEVTWSSNRPEIATVTEYGLVTATGEGRATITATSVDNPKISGTFTVIVNPKIPVQSITLSHSEWTGNIGESINLLATLTPANATVTTVTWKSSNENAATVSDYGTVTAVNQGEATITATADGGQTATCNVTVNPRVLVTSIALTSSSGTWSVVEGGQLTLVATVAPDNATDQTIEWTSSKEDIATVSSYGLVTGIKAGTAIITAKTTDGSNKSAYHNITVTAKIPVTRVTVSPTSATLNVGGTQRLTATVTPSNATYGSVVWTSSDPNIVRASGRDITAMNPGTATITATSVDDPTKFGTCTVTVRSQTVTPVTGISVSPTSCSIKKGNTRTLTATVTPNNATDKNVIWVSSNPQIASVDNGIVTGVSNGSAVITAVSVGDPSKTAICNVTVTD